MSNIELSPQDASILHRILESYLAELRTEMAGTVIDGVADLLALEAELINRLLPELEQASPAEPIGGAGEYV